MSTKHQPKLAREMLTSLGIGQFNATMIIPFLWFAPATTDPRSSPVLMLVRAIQRNLFALGASLHETGFLDEPTAAVLERLMGPGWMNGSWAEVVGAVLAAKRNHYTFAVQPAVAPEVHGPQAVGGVLDFLPDVPGGMLTYAVGGLVAYHFWKKRKR